MKTSVHKVYQVFAEPHPGAWSEKNSSYAHICMHVFAHMPTTAHTVFQADLSGKNIPCVSGTLKKNNNPCPQVRVQAVALSWQQGCFTVGRNAVPGHLAWH